MNSLYVVQLEAKPGLLIAVIEEGRQKGRNSRRIEIPLRTASPKQRADWQRLAGRSALGLHRMLGGSGELAIRLSGRRAVVGADGDGVPSAQTELPFDGREAAWELAAAEAGGGPEVPAALGAAAEVARTHLAFGLTLAGVDPGELAGAAMAAWSDGWAAAPDDAEPKAAPRAASEGGGREIAEWIASAAEKNVLHEHGRLPDDSAPAADQAAPQTPGLSLLSDSASAEAALAELRRAMRARFGG